MVLSNKNPLSDEHKRKLSEAHKGKIPWNKGKTMSKEYKEIHSKAAKGRTMSEEQKKKISESLKGRKLSQETRNKMSKSSKEKGNGQWMTGRSLPKEVCEKISVGNRGKEVSPETRNKISVGNTGKKHSRETIKKLRLERIKQISEAKFNGNQVFPSWNPKACDYFEEFDKDNNTEGQHARNGGEFYISELGYWVDYINHDLKLIMEYDEPYHQNPKQKEKDMIRQQEIQEHLSDYEIRRIDKRIIEKGEWK